MAVTISSIAGGCSRTENPLLTDSSAPYGAPMFSQIKNEDYEPAFEPALQEAREEIADIAGRTDEPTFANTIEALAYSGERLD